MKQLTARRDEWLSRTQAKQEADKRLERLNASVEASERAVNKAEAAWADAQQNADARRKELEALREARKSILGGEDVEAVQKRLNEAAAKAERAFEDAQMKQQRASSELTSCQTKIETQKKELN